MRLERALAKHVVNQTDLIASGSRSVICKSHSRDRRLTVPYCVSTINAFTMRSSQPTSVCTYEVSMWCVCVMRACVRACVCACVYVRACVRVCVRACVRVCVRTCVRAYVRACVRVYNHMLHFEIFLDNTPSRMNHLIFCVWCHSQVI